MGLFVKDTVIGLDYLIDKAQRKIFSKLSAKWNIQIDAYPRCYVIEDKNSNPSIQHYEGNGEYSGDLIFSEGQKFFFTAEDEQERINNEHFTTKVKLYFMLDLESIYPEVKDRSDSLILADVVDVLDNTPGFEKNLTIITDWRQVFESFEYESDNIQPYYCFRVDLKTNPYSINQKC